MSGVTPLYAGGSSKFGASSRAFGQLPRNSGFLEKLSSGGMLSSPKWQRRYFALGDGVLAWAKTATKITNCGEACLKLCVLRHRGLAFSSLQFHRSRPVPI